MIAYPELARMTNQYLYSGIITGNASKPRLRAMRLQVVRRNETSKTDSEIREIVDNMDIEWETD